MSFASLQIHSRLIPILKKLVLGVAFFALVGCKPEISAPDSKKYSAKIPDEVLVQIQKAELCAHDSFQLAEKFMDEGLMLSRNPKNPLVEGKVLAAYGELWRLYAPVFSDKREALRYYQLSNDQFAQVQDTVEMARNHFRIGLLLATFQDYENASEEFLKAESLFEMSGNKMDLISLELELAGIFLETGELERASIYGGAAYELAETTGQDSLKPQILNTMGKVHLLLGHELVSIEYFLEGIEQANSKQRTSLLPGLMNNAGLALIALDQPDTARYYLRQALSLATAQAQFEQLAISFQGLANAELMTQNLPQALALLDSSSALARDYFLGKMLLENYHTYISIYKQMGETGNALVYYDKLLVLQDSLNLLEEKMDIVRIDARYGLLQMEDENYRLLDNDKLLRSRQQMLILLGLLLLVLMLFFYVQYRSKKKINARLNALVDKRTEQLRLAYAEVVELNKELDIFAYRTAHDIRGPVARLLGLCELVLPIEIKHPEVERYMRLIYNEAKNMDFMLLRFLEVNHIKHVRGGDEPLDLSEVIWGIYKDMLNKGLEGAEITRLQVSIPPDLRVKAQPKLLEIVLKNLLMNSINFKAPKDAWVELKARVDGNYLRLSVLDNGQGVAPEVAPRIFEMFYRGSTSSKGLGLGLYAAQLAVHKMGGSVRLVHSQPGNTEFLVILPYLAV